jgi:hypothetical protein
MIALTESEARTMEPDEKDREIERLRSEVAMLSGILDGVQCECRTLHSIVVSLAHGRRVPAARTLVQVGSRERMAMLEDAVGTLDDFVRESARGDCYSECQAEDADYPKCTTCRAKEILESISAWRFGGSTEVPSRRFVGSMHYRTENGWNPREAKIHRAWAKYMERYGPPDYTLGQILTDRSPGQPDGVRDWPTARDWYVATSVVQWLVTNCGSTILEQAGWKYTQWSEDAAQIHKLEEARK